MRRTKYTADLLAPIVASATTLTDVIRKLGLQPNGGNHRFISARIRQAGLDTSHFTKVTSRETIEAIPRERLEATVKECRSVDAVLARLDLPVGGRWNRVLSRWLEELSIDTSHFQGRGWSRGLTAAQHSSLAKIHAARTFPDDIVFVENGPFLTGPRLTRRLIAKGWSYQCVICGIAEWCGKPLVLHLDHINGINNDHRFENLRLLCPNCHSQTETYCTGAREESLCYTFDRNASVA